MNREILFRGFHPDEKGKEIIYIDGKATKGEWVEGYYFQYHNMHFILPLETKDSKHFYLFDYAVEVIPSTVGQFTGLTDKNGKRIFEGDIVKCTDINFGYDFTAVVEFGNPNGEYSWGFQLKQISGEKANTDILLWVEMEDSGALIEVIGNLWDNPELIESEE